MNKYNFKVFPQKNFIDLGLLQFGRERCNPAYSFGPAARNHYLFHYVISGKGTLHAHNSQGKSISYKVNANEGFLLFPNQISLYIADNENPWDYVWVEFDGLQVKSAIEQSGLSEDNPIYRASPAEMRHSLLDEMLYIVNNEDASPLQLIGHLYLFLDFLSHPIVPKNAAQKIDRKNDSGSFYISEAIRYIELNYQNDISVEEIAAKCGLTRSYFGKKFKEEFGKTPQEFLLQFRMSKATELLKETKLPIGEISSAVGYNDQLHFSRAFKNIYGVSPRSWREKYCHNS